MKSSDQAKALILLLATLIFAYFFYQRTVHEDFPGENKNRLAHSLLEEGNLEEALKTFNEAISLNPDYPDSYRGKGITLMMMKQFDESKEMFDKAIELDESFAVAYANRGRLYDLSGNYASAIRDYRKAIELNPKLAEGPGLLWRFLHKADKKPATIRARADYLEEQLKKPEDERIMRIPELDAQQKMYKK